jgi:hypothetical protein
MLDAFDGMEGERKSNDMLLLDGRILLSTIGLAYSYRMYSSVE